MIIFAGNRVPASRFSDRRREGYTLSDYIEGVHGQHEVMTRVYGPTWCVWIVPGTLVD